MDANFFYLAVPASVAFACLVAHAIKLRGLRTALLFFGTLIAFGLLRGNLVYLITKGHPPYSFELPVMRLGHTGLVEALGWCIALYVSWCMAERVLVGRALHEKNLLAILFFACAVMMGFAIMLEAAAGRMEWWSWKPPRGLRESPAFRDIERGITEWFSVGFDFLTPWLLLTHARLKRRWITLVGLIPFPFHFGMHHIRRVHLDNHLVKVNHLSHFVMLAAAVLLPYFFYIEMKRVPDFRVAGTSFAQAWTRRLDAVGLMIVVAAVCFGLVFVAGEPELCLFSLPLVLFAMYAVRRSETHGVPPAAHRGAD